MGEEENYDSMDESETVLSTLHEALLIESSNPHLQRFRVNKKLPPIRPPQKKNNVGIKMFACNLCSDLFLSYDLRKEHYLKCHVKKQTQTEKKLYECNVCKRKFESYQERKDHHKLHMKTSPQTSKIEERIEILGKEIKTQMEKKFPCIHDNCEESFSSSEEMFSHYIVHVS